MTGAPGAGAGDAPGMGGAPGEGDAAGDSYLPPEAAGSAPGRGRLVGRRVLVVGAGTRPSPEPDPPIGNGRAIAVLAAREGASVVCADRDRAAAEVTAELVRAEGSRAEVVLADVADPRACTAVVEESVAALGGLDGLVLNVGFGLGRGITGTTAQQWDAVFAVNTRAHFLVSAAALPVLAPRSAIVYISSAASLRAATGVPSYDSSKAALLGICRQVAREGMASRIRANLVVPSLVDTPLGRDASRRNPARTARRIPFGRQATAWEVAYATVWLLSSEASYINAHSLVLDGGATSFA
jgi:NAD(P)-dependent dehydrogenase (short-subunit alcohol dehydrogenase family)